MTLWLLLPVINLTFKNARIFGKFIEGTLRLIIMIKNGLFYYADRDHLGYRMIFIKNIAQLIHACQRLFVNKIP